MGKEKIQMSLKTPKGTQDWEGKDMVIRDRIFSTIATVFKRHGGVTIDTPVFELREILAGKYGEDSKLIYDLQDQGGELCSLRYDLTVPFARWLAMNPQIQNIKRYHIAKVYRRDQPAMTKGRKREFYQCDFDIAGTYDSMLPDAEILRIVCEIFQELGWDGKFSIKINHRGILDGVFAVCGVPTDKTRAISSAVDKLDKSPWEEVRKEMVEEKGLSEEVADKIWDYVQNKGGPEILSKLQNDEALKDDQSMQKGLADMELLFRYLSAFKVLPFIEFNLSLARGLDYYTGVIYEVITEGSAPSSSATAQSLQRGGKKSSSSSKPPASKNLDDEDRSSDPSVGVGSIAAGGRYDHLTEKFNPRALVPCVGISFGVDRIFSVTKARMEATGGAQKIRHNEVDVFVMAFGGKGFNGMLEERMEVARTLWEAGIKAEFLFKVKPKLPAQFKAADVGGVPFAVILGEDEQKAGKAKIKELGLPDEHPEKEGVLVSIESLVEEVKTRLWRKGQEDGIYSVGSITAETNGLKIGTQNPSAEVKGEDPPRTGNDGQLPIIITPEKHKGKLEIRDSAGRLVYSRRSLDQFLANTRHGSQNAAAVGASSQQPPTTTGSNMLLSTPGAFTSPIRRNGVFGSFPEYPAVEGQPQAPAPASRSKANISSPEQPSITLSLFENLRIQEILQKIRDSPEGKPFCSPFKSFLNPYKDKLEQEKLEHVSTIEYPMDLTTIQDRTISCKYPTTDAILADFDLMLQNTVHCVGDDDPLTEMAKRVRSSFEEQLDAVTPRRTADISSNKRPRTDSQLPEESPTVNGEPNATKQKTGDT